MSRTQLPWMLTVQPGDVLRSRSGDLRVVREVCRYSNGDLRSVTVVIRKCSWTKRPYTVINYTDLRLLGYEHTGQGVKLDERLQKALCISGKRGKLTCCDVRGIP